MTPCPAEETKTFKLSVNIINKIQCVCTKTMHWAMHPHWWGCLQNNSKKITRWNWQSTQCSFVIFCSSRSNELRNRHVYWYNNRSSRAFLHLFIHNCGSGNETYAQEGLESWWKNMYVGLSSCIHTLSVVNLQVLCIRITDHTVNQLGVDLPSNLRIQYSHSIIIEHSKKMHNINIGNEHKDLQNSEPSCSVHRCN